MVKEFTLLANRNTLMKSLDGMHPKVRNQVAWAILQLIVGAARPDIDLFKSTGDEKISVGEYRILFTSKKDGCEILHLVKRNDGYTR